ncbi:putative mitochondrial inner membrane protease subunit Imp2 [Aspergillus fischeri NRRL 181]|uniref:Mitochondrial inner membrane protease subunit 2 n=1 Tax=Neosartorya fischeri (strain ATCC 1020 / DSM 3700 / CBS 544.65 / FGSC A1164 / JCM 1740 / NRRL 181 / WB 181) TaxID=331117 RepID=A1D637_NEOFI|nr:mitochondrial inner membrane protease subunit Imp2, putative [Aspergillus fischeri NRRL 181]EAW21181.1 mitochondrial inner membrane protease subunit Imp2, putative [Aspergillus fischeri NRRL 181]
MPPPQPTPEGPPTGKTTSRFRVLAPEMAKIRSSRSPVPPTTPPSASASASAPASAAAYPSPSLPQTQTQTPPQSSPRPNRPSLSSLFRQRYATLPTPIRRTFRVLRILAPIVPIGIFFSEHVLQVMWVRGPSMTPFLNEDYETMHTKSDMVLVNMWPFGGAGWPWERKRRLERGMIVTFRSPANPKHTAIKRVIGLPGDRITTREPCMKASQIVPFNHVWLEGDAEDPKKSLDSNTYGPVSISLITGRVIAVLRPQFRWLKWRDWEKGVVEGDGDHRFGENYRQDVRQRVLKEAVKLERPQIE